MTTYTTNTAPLISNPIATPWLSRLVARYRAAAAARTERRETYHALRYLSDRELEDIGLTRADVIALR